MAGSELQELDATLGGGGSGGGGGSSFTAHDDGWIDAVATGDVAGFREALAGWKASGGGGVNRVSEIGVPAAWVACAYGQEEIVQALLDEGADFEHWGDGNGMSRNGHGCLHLAAGAACRHRCTPPALLLPPG